MAEMVLSVPTRAAPLQWALALNCLANGRALLGLNSGTPGACKAAPTIRDIDLNLIPLKNIISLVLISHANG